jgi:hypothetical protein
MSEAEGHWVTIEGRHILIRDPIGHGRGFSKAALHRHLIEHHKSVSGGEGSYTAADERALTEAAGAGDPFTFYKKLPTEIKEFQAGRPELRSMFKVSNDAADAGGADAFGELGDRYLKIAEAKAGSPLRAALDTARNSNDPEVRFAAAIHDHLPPESAASLNQKAAKSAKAGDTETAKEYRQRASELPESTNIDPSKLRVGQSFTIQGDTFHVIEDADGFKVLSGPSDYPEVPVEALKQVPIDRGSLRAAKAKIRARGDAVAPFSRSTGVLYLFAAGGEAKPAITLGQALPKTRNSLPCFYYWRQSIADGEYVHPVKKFGLKVDASRRRTWEQNFRRMKDAGEEVPIVEDHADAKSNATLGYVVDVRQNGKWYEELHQYLGERERDTALRNKISIGIDPDFHTGNGVRLGDCIIHSATTPRPVVPGQGEAVPIAASRGPAGDVLELSAARQESTMDLNPLRKALGLADDAPDADVISSATTKLAAVPALETDKATALSRVTAAEAERDAAKAQVLELSRANPKQPDPEVAYERQKRLASEADAAVAQGKLAPFLADTFKGWLAKENQLRPLMLSRDTEADECVAEKLLPKLIEASPKIKFGEQTGAQQTLALGRAAYGNPGDAGNDEEAKKIDEFMKERQAQRKTA